jgi:L-2-hydroxyglutarate oxidase LhgO
VQGNRLLYAFCARQGVPALRTGKLIVATSSEEEDVLDFYWKRSRENRVPQVKRISGGAVSALEPNVKARSALLVPTAGIVEPTRLVYRLHVLSSKQGVQFLPGTEVVDIENRGDRIGLQLCYPDKKREWVRARAVINAGGVEADRLARRLNPRTPHVLDPVRGESYKFYGHKRPELRLAGMNVYPTPEEVITPNGRHFTVGIHLTPTFGDWSSPPRTGSTVTVGPKLVPARDRDGWEGTPVSAGVFAEQVRPFFPGVRAEDLIWHQAGLQARLKGHPDFVVQRDEACPHCIHLMGIDSPGLTSCLAIARHVKALIKSLGLD